MNRTASHPTLRFAHALNPEKAAELEALKVTLRRRDSAPAVLETEELVKAKASAKAAARADRAVTARLARLEAQVSVKSKKQQLREQSAELMTAARALLKQYLPRQPYAVGVGAELEALRPEAILARAVRFALQERVRSEFYLTKLTDPGAHRYGIGGADCGPVSDEDRAHGLERLEALRKQKSKASRQGNGSHIREQSIPGSGLSAPKFPGEHSEA